MQNEALSSLNDLTQLTDELVKTIETYLQSQAQSAKGEGGAAAMLSAAVRNTAHLEAAFAQLKSRLPKLAEAVKAIHTELTKPAQKPLKAAKSVAAVAEDSTEL